MILYSLSILIEPKLKEIDEKDKAKKKTEISTIEDIESILATSHPKDWLYDDAYGIYTYKHNVDLNIRIRDEIY